MILKLCGVDRIFYGYKKNGLHFYAPNFLKLFVIVLGSFIFVRFFFWCYNGHFTKTVLLQYTYRSTGNCNKNAIGSRERLMVEVRTFPAFMVVEWQTPGALHCKHGSPAFVYLCNVARVHRPQENFRVFHDKKKVFDWARDTTFEWKCLIVDRAFQI